MTHSFEFMANTGVDDISWRKHHRYLILVSDHATSKIVLGASGKNDATLDGFFSEIRPENPAAIEVLSMDIRAPDTDLRPMIEFLDFQSFFVGGAAVE